MRDEPHVTLREAMAAAAQRDTIASEYVTDHAVTFELGLPALADALGDGLRARDAIVELALRLLAAVPDTLIARKRGTEAAGRVAAGARQVLERRRRAQRRRQDGAGRIRCLAAPGRQRAQPGDHGRSRHRRAVRGAAGGRALSPGEPILVVSVSARMLAELGVRAGHDVVALDRFGDLDLQRLCPSVSVLRDLGGRGGMAALVDAAEEIAAPSVIYGAGLENQPGLVARLASGRTLLGCTRETLERVRDPATLGASLRAAGPRLPATFGAADAPRRPSAPAAGCASRCAAAADGAFASGAAARSTAR